MDGIPSRTTRKGTSLDQDFLNQMVVTPQREEYQIPPPSTCVARDTTMRWASTMMFSVMGAMRRLLENFTGVLRQSAGLYRGGPL